MAWPAVSLLPKTETNNTYFKVIVWLLSANKKDTQEKNSNCRTYKTKTKPNNHKHLNCLFTHNNCTKTGF